MGCTQSSEQLEAIKHSKDLEKQMAQDYQKEAQKIKLLLLGAGESGKSTIFKQMKVLYGQPLTEDERKHFTQIVYTNVITLIKALATQVERYGFKVELTPAQQDSFAAVMNLSEYDAITPELAAHIKSLWNSPTFQKTWARRSEFQVVDSHKVFLDEIERIGARNYLATQADVLLTRVRTSGIVTERYMIDQTEFEMYDVGGQRNERKKWIHCFESVTAVIFVAALSEYDQTLYEDSTTNRMVEAIHLFEDVCNKAYFENSSMILFLNKQDLFAEKVGRVHIKSVEAFSDYTGPLGNAEMGTEYFLQKFLAVNSNPEREIYHHATCATDTENVSFVWNSCKDIILKNNLKESGFI